MGTIRKTVDISGMGGSYEWACQKMLDNGLAWIKKNPKKEVEFKAFQGVTGLAIADNAEAKELEKALLQEVEGVSGGQFHAVIGHLLFIRNNGYDAWLKVFNDEPDRYFEFDGTVESCPKTELSEKMDRQSLKN